MATYQKFKSERLSHNFKSHEFDCHCDNDSCSTTTIDPELVNLLQKIRDMVKVSVIINSGYRCPVHNTNVGGAKSSYHMNGKAADICASGMEPSKLAEVAERCCALGIGLYDTFVHVDVRPRKYYWIDGKGEVDTFINDDAAKMGAELRAVLAKYGY